MDRRFRVLRAMFDTYEESNEFFRGRTTYEDWINRELSMRRDEPSSLTLYIMDGQFDYVIDLVRSVFGYTWANVARICVEKGVDSD